MTNTPGDGEQPEDPTNPYGVQPGSSPADQGQQPGYWQQQSQNPQQSYPPQGYGQQGYGQQPQPGYPVQYAPDHPKATTARVLGILGIVLCGIMAPFAWSIGKRAVAEIDGSNGALGGRGAANAGYILGVIGTILLGLAVLFFIGVMGLAVLGAATSSTGSY